jgi:hypothetical protein
MEQDMLGLVPNLKYTDHDIMDEKKFLELVPSKYLKKYINEKIQMIVIEPQTWEKGLDKDDILNLFDIPHFGRSTEINIYIKLLLRCVHISYLWIDRSISLNTNLIV